MTVFSSERDHQQASVHGCDLCMSVVYVGVCKKYEIFHVPEGSS